MKWIGTIQHIYRYPVKSFQGESLDRVAVGPYGLYGDRAFSFIDHTRDDKHLNAKHVPRLLAYSSRYTGEGSAEQFPPVEVTAPDGRQLSWDEQLFREIRGLSNREITPQQFAPGHEGLLAVDQANILITTDASQRELEHIVGLPADVGRFRPNFVIRLAESRPFDEHRWIGSRITVAGIELEVYKKCKRCSMVNVDPRHNDSNPLYLKKIAEHLDACFGVYAKVVTTGNVAVGDAVYLN